MNLNAIADPSIESVLDLLVDAEALASGPDSMLNTEVDQRRADVSERMDQLNGLLRESRWAEQTTGVQFVRLLAGLVEARGSELEKFVNQTIDVKRNTFRPYRISKYLATQFGVKITNHTVGRMMALLAEAGQRRNRRPLRLNSPHARGQGSLATHGCHVRQNASETLTDGSMRCIAHSRFGTGQANSHDRPSRNYRQRPWTAWMKLEGQQRHRVDQ